MFLTTCIIIPARSYLVNAFFEFFQNYLYKFPAGSCIRILGRRAVRLELPSHLFRRVSGAGRPARVDAGPAGRAERPEHRVQWQTVHPVRDQPDAACQRTQCAQVEETVNPLHFRDIHNTRGLYALDILLRLGKGCADLCAFFLGNIHDNHRFILKWVAKWVRANEKHPETYVSRCYFLVGAGGLREPRI